MAAKTAIAIYIRFRPPGEAWQAKQFETQAQANLFASIKKSVGCEINFREVY